MLKKFIAAFVAAVLLVPGALQAASFEDIMPDSAMVTADFQLTGKLKTWLTPFIKNALEAQLNQTNSDEKPKIELMVSKLVDKGEPVFIGFAMPENIYFAMPGTESDMDVLKGDAESHEYEGVSVYVDGDTIFALVKDYLVLTSNLDSIHTVIDLATGKSTNSLGAKASYAKMRDFYFSPRYFSFTLHLGNLGAVLGPLAAMSGGSGELEQTGAKLIADLLSLFEYEGFSFAESASGYTLNFKVAGNAEKLKEKNFSLNPGGSFTPNLYRKFPSGKPLMYFEGYNLKAGNENQKKLLEMMKHALGDTTSPDFNELIKKETGLDLDLLYSALEKEVAFGIQFNPDSPIPYATIMADVSANRAAGEKQLELAVDGIDWFLEENTSDIPEKAVKRSEANGFTKYTLDLTKLDDYDGPPNMKITLSLGITPDNLLIVSNFPGIGDASKRTGFVMEETGTNTGIFYLSMRNFWEYFDGALAWVEKVSGGKNGPPLNFYREYYSALEFIYGWRDLLVVSQGSETEASAVLEFRVDGAKHKTYEQLVKEMQDADQDDDGVSDYDERYVYSTPVASRDSDDDGMEDFEELQKGFDPERADERLFSDVSEDAYYTDEVGLMYQRGAIKGYKDGTFQPGKSVNRAEFTTMVVQTFEQKTSNLLGVNLELSKGYEPFTDVGDNDWFTSYIAKAYTAGFISGSYDAKTGYSIFRPGDDITRAEALAILNKASKALSKNRKSVSCADSPFRDVNQDDWFCEAVANGYQHGITKGKSEGVFAPNESINRADAAIMIRRTLEKDLELLRTAPSPGSTVEELLELEF